MIQRTNIVNLLAGRQNVYHSAVLTCFTFDPIFFESVYMQALRQLGVVNCVVLMDAVMYDKLMADPAYTCHRVHTNNYTLVRQTSRGHGAFHSKLTLLVGEDECSVLVGSGNLTFSGISQNEEVWNAIHIKGADSKNFPLLHEAWKYINSVTSLSPTLVKRQISWMAEQTAWLNNEAEGNTITLDSGETAMLLYNSPEHSILSQLEEAIGDAEVSDITVISPFYDTKGDMLMYLKDKYMPLTFRCVLDIQRQSAPYDLIKENKGIDFEKYAGEGVSNPLHAKIFEFQTENGTWLLSGSANAGNVAFGTTSDYYNDEVCVLLHHPSQYSYIEELGFASKTQPLAPQDREEILQNRRQAEDRVVRNIKLYSCELKEKGLELCTSDSGTKVQIQILNEKLKPVYVTDVDTDRKVVVPVSEAETKDWHIAVISNGSEEISNRCLIISENEVETCNPDPKRRKLSSLLDDRGLFDNMNHILAYIEFDEKENSHNTHSLPAQHKEKEEKVIYVSKEDYDVLKDRSSMSISMHSGVRILSYLQKILFNEQIDDEHESTSDDTLLEISNEEEGGDVSKVIEYDYDETTTMSNEQKAKRLRNDVSNYLKKMQVFLEKKIADPSVQEEGSKAMPNLPKLMAMPGLNAGSSMSTAAYAVTYLMKEYGNSVHHRSDLLKQLTDCAGLFFALYSFNLPLQDNNVGRKTIEILKDACSMLLISLTYFDCKRNDREVVLTVLNCLNMWNNREQDLVDVIATFNEKLQQINNDNVDRYAADRVRSVINTYLNHPAEIHDCSVYVDHVYMFKGGYGYFVVDGFCKTDKGWRFTYHHPRYKMETNSSASKYKGYTNMEI